MTQEKIQQKAYEVYPLDLDRHMIIEGEPYDNNKEKREAYIMGLTDSLPSFPSNLDEAAEEYFEQYNYMPKGFVINAFKAGAEWMAGQGVTKEAVIGMATKDIELNVSGQVLDKLELGPGDKVIVQIRKKVQ